MKARRYKILLAAAFTLVVMIVLWGANAAFSVTKFITNSKAYDTVLDNRDEAIRNVLRNGPAYLDRVQKDETLNKVIRRALSDVLVLRDGSPVIEKLPKGVEQADLEDAFSGNALSYATLDGWRAKRSLLVMGVTRYTLYSVVSYPLGTASVLTEFGWFVIATSPVGLIMFLLAWLFVARSLAPMEEQMRRLEEFSSDVSHELRTPIAVIRSSLELAARTGEWIEASREVKDASLRMEKTVFSLLRLATLARWFEDVKEVDLTAEIRDATRHMNTLHAEAAFRTECDVSKAWKNYRVAADHWRICLDNFLSNATKYAKSKIIVRLVGGELWVEDDGPGIAPEHIKKIFDRYWQERKDGGRYGGYGVGLAIVRKICELRGWEAGARIRPEGGTTFFLRFERE